MGMNADSPVPIDEPALDDLAVLALDAVDADEEGPLRAQLATDPAAAGTEQALRRAAGEFGASASIIVETTPPPELRARVLAAALGRRAPAPVTAALPVGMHRTELGRVLALLRTLDAEVWARPVDPPEFEGWTVHDLVAHLAANEALLAEALGVPVAVPDRGRTNEARTAEAQARHRTLEPQAVVDELEAAAAAVDAQVSARSEAELDQLLDYWGRPTTVRGTLLTRAFETWTHADDVRRAAGLAEVAPPPATMFALCRAAVGLVPAMLRARGDEPPDALVRVHLSGPGAHTWDLTLPSGPPEPAGAPAADVELFVDTVALCRAVSNRIPAGGLDYTSRGDTALAERIVGAIPALAVL
jgi:uncharacterized protein (TIGR03083 family)